MTHREAFEKLERLLQIAEQIRKDGYSTSDEASQVRREMYELYGAVEELYQQIAGRREVTINDGVSQGTFATYFEAGFLSGRTIHSHQGYTELSKVIGRVREMAENPGVPKDAPSIATVIEILQRFRQCCQYLRKPPTSERDVQDIMWIMLRSRFDRLDREDTLPRFGVKKYVPDFGIHELGLLVEAKFIGDATRPSGIQEEILADVHQQN